jgi:iron(III) transport system permease protein
MVAASLQVSATAAAITVAIALGLAYAVRVTRSPWVSGVGRFASFGYAVPGAVLAIGILIPLARFDNAFATWAQSQFGINPGLLLTGTVAALVYAYVVRFLAVGLNNVESGFARITPHMDEAARSLGCGPWSLLCRVHVPLLARSLAVAALLVFVDALKELPATLALRPFNFDTLATQAYNFAKDERLGEAALPSLVIVAVALLPVLLTTRVLASGRRD